MSNIQKSIRELGFESSIESLLPIMIPKVSSAGGKGVLRDTTLFGIRMLLELKGWMLQLDPANSWNYIHIILTSGEDTGSIASLDEINSVIQILNEHFEPGKCKTIFIGIDMANDSPNFMDIKSMVSSAGRDFEIFNVSSINFEPAFSKIQKSVNKSRKGNNCAWLFSLDVNESLSDMSWQKIKGSLSTSLKSWYSYDLIGGAIFSNGARMTSANKISQTEHVIKRNPAQALPPTPTFREAPHQQTYYPNQQQYVSPPIQPNHNPYGPVNLPPVQAYFPAGPQYQSAYSNIAYMPRPQSSETQGSDTKSKKLKNPISLKHSEEFEEAFCGFCYDPIKCICLIICLPPLSCFCTQIGAVSNATGQGCCAPCMLLLCCGCIGAAFNRGSIRGAYGIKGSCCTDLLAHCLCMLCAVSQEYREVQRRNCR